MERPDAREIMTMLIDKGLVTNYGGGATKRKGGHVKFYPYKKGRGSFSYAEGGGGHKRFWGSFLRCSLKF